MIRLELIAEAVGHDYRALEAGLYGLTPEANPH